jgi:DNA-directed RNA polymerase specialized sigma24 family protein
MTFPPGNPHSITASGFARLLERLHPDADRAAEEYERLRRALMKFFDWRGITPADECADEVLDRLTRKLEQTVIQDVTKYVHGIARMVALERRRRPIVSSLDDRTGLTLAAPVSAADDEASRRHDCFERCLARLPEESRSLLLRYYDGERSVKISNRRRLASMLGVTENALRSRVQRLRDRLEECVQACATQPMGETS